MTDSPRKLLAFFIGTRCENHSRERAAAVLGSVSTFTRAIRVLKMCDAITVQHGGRSTPCKITVLMTIQEFLTRYRELTRYVAQIDPLNAKVDPLSGAYSLRKKYKERKLSQMEQKERKPPQMEQNLSEADRLYRECRFSAWRGLSGLSAEQIKELFPSEAASA